MPNYCKGIFIVFITFFKSIAQVVETSDQSEKEQEIVTDRDGNRKIRVAEALTELDEVKNFIEVNGSDYLNMIFNESIENVEQIKVKNEKPK